MTYVLQQQLPALAMQFYAQNLEIVNSSFDSLTSMALAALAFSASNVTFRNCSFTANENSAGGHCRSAWTQEAVLRSDCSVALAVGGIYANDSSTVLVQDSFFADNQGQCGLFLSACRALHGCVDLLLASRGPGRRRVRVEQRTDDQRLVLPEEQRQRPRCAPKLALAAPRQLRSQQLTLWKPAGGGVSANNASQITITESDFVNNTATNGGGMYVMGCAAAQLDTNMFVGNEVTHSGAGLFMEQCSGACLAGRACLTLPCA